MPVVWPGIITFHVKQFTYSNVKFKFFDLQKCISLQDFMHETEIPTEMSPLQSSFVFIV